MAIQNPNHYEIYICDDLWFSHQNVFEYISVCIFNSNTFVLTFIFLLEQYLGKMLQNSYEFETIFWSKMIFKVDNHIVFVEKNRCSFSRKAK